jgi:hypothetical protein
VELLKDRVFTRGTGSPFTETVTFPGLSGKALIKLTNGDAGSKKKETRVSSAEVSVNGAVVFGSASFNQNVGYLEKEISLLDGQNTLAVNLKSKPGSKISVTIIQTIETDTGSEIPWTEDFESPYWNVNWPTLYPGSGLAYLKPNNTLNGSNSLILDDNADSTGPMYVYRDFTIPSGSKSVTLELSINVHSYEPSYNHGPHIILADASAADPNGLSHDFTSFETNQFNPGYFNNGVNRCTSGGQNNFIGTGFHPTLGSWYDIQIVMNLEDGSTQFWAKESSASNFKLYGTYPKDPCSTGTFNRLYLGTGLSTSYGAVTEFDNISMTFSTSTASDRPLTHWGYTPLVLNMAGYPGMFGVDNYGYAINYDTASVTVAWTTDARSVTFNSPFHSGSAPDPSFQITALSPSSGGIPATIDVTEVGHDAYQEWGYLSSSADLGGQYMDGSNWYLVGELTPLSTLNSLAAQGKTGRYTGTVNGTYYVNGSPHATTAEVSGTFSCDVNFQTRTVDNISITFSGNGHPFTYTSGSASWTSADSQLYSHDGIPTIDNSPVATGNIFGAFFGPDAEKIGGLFGLTTSWGNPHISAILKGDR